MVTVDLVDLHLVAYSKKWIAREIILQEYWSDPQPDSQPDSQLGCRQTVRETIEPQ